MIEINLQQDFAELAADLLQQYGFDKPVTDNPRQVLIDFLNFQHRKIPQQKRTIHKPKNFTCPSQYEKALELLEAKIVDGEDLTPYQSRKILKYEKKDALLNDWGIQHLHLGTKMMPTKPLIEGTPDVLFVFFKNQDAYFITIAGHDTWSNQDMIRVLHDNFPASIESWRVKDVIGLSMIPSDEDIKKLRGHGINSGLEIYPGVVYFGPGGGYASDGTNMWVSMKANDYARFSNKAEKLIRDKEEHIREELSKNGFVVPTVLQISMELENNDFILFERNTNAEITRVPSSSI